MAETVTEFPEGPEASYPWVEWGDGQIWELTQGVDFTVDTRTLASLARRTAWRRGLQARVAIRGPKITLQFLPRHITEQEPATP